MERPKKALAGDKRVLLLERYGYRKKVWGSVQLMKLHDGTKLTVRVWFNDPADTSEIFRCQLFLDDECILVEYTSKKNQKTKPYEISVSNLGSGSTELLRWYFKHHVNKGLAVGDENYLETPVHRHRADKVLIHFKDGSPDDTFLHFCNQLWLSARDQDKAPHPPKEASKNRTDLGGDAIEEEEEEEEEDEEDKIMVVDSENESVENGVSEPIKKRKREGAKEGVKGQPKTKKTNDSPVIANVGIRENPGDQNRISSSNRRGKRVLIKSKDRQKASVAAMAVKEKRAQMQKKKERENGDSGVEKKKEGKERKVTIPAVPSTEEEQPREEARESLLRIQDELRIAAKLLRRDKAEVEQAKEEVEKANDAMMKCQESSSEYRKENVALSSRLSGADDALKEANRSHTLQREVTREKYKTLRAAKVVVDKEIERLTAVVAKHESLLTAAKVEKDSVIVKLKGKIALLEKQVKEKCPKCGGASLVDLQADEDDEDEEDEDEDEDEEDEDEDEDEDEGEEEDEEDSDHEEDDDEEGEEDAAFAPGLGDDAPADGKKCSSSMSVPLQIARSAELGSTARVTKSAIIMPGSLEPTKSVSPSDKKDKGRAAATSTIVSGSEASHEDDLEFANALDAAACDTPKKPSTGNEGDSEEELSDADALDMSED